MTTNDDIRKAQEALNNAKVPTEDRHIMDTDDPRVFNPLADTEVITATSPDLDTTAESGENANEQ